MSSVAATPRLAAAPAANKHMPAGKQRMLTACFVDAVLAQPPARSTSAAYEVCVPRAWQTLVGTCRACSVQQGAVVDLAGGGLRSGCAGPHSLPDQTAAVALLWIVFEIASKLGAADCLLGLCVVSRLAAAVLLAARLRLAPGIAAG